MHDRHGGAAKRKNDEAFPEAGNTKSLVLIEAVGLVRALADKSSCSRGKVGCAIYDYGGKLVSCAWNDNEPPGCEHPDVKGGCGCVHAEIRALVTPREKSSGRPYYAVVSRAPCPYCAKALIWAGVREFYFIEESWPWSETKKLLDRLYLSWQQIRPRDVPQ